MVVPLGPVATAPTRTAAFDIAHSSATPIGTRSLKTRPRDIEIVPQTPSPRGFFSSQVIRRRTGDRAASGYRRGRCEFSIQSPVFQEIPARILGSVPRFSAVVVFVKG